MTLSDDGNKYVWCQHHGPNNGKSGNQTGMYMLDNQNHTKLLAKKKKKANAQKDQQKESKAASNKRKASFDTASNTDYNAEKRGKNGKLTLSKSFKSAIVTKLKLSDPEVQDIWDTAMTNANKYSNDNSDDK